MTTHDATPARCCICLEALGDEPVALTMHGDAHKRCSKARAVRKIQPLGDQTPCARSTK